jgi:hypothetical protein
MVEQNIHFLEFCYCLSLEFKGEFINLTIKIKLELSAFPSSHCLFNTKRTKQPNMFYKPGGLDLSRSEFKTCQDFLIRQDMICFFLGQDF